MKPARIIEKTLKLEKKTDFKDIKPVEMLISTIITSKTAQKTTAESNERKHHDKTGRKISTSSIPQTAVKINTSGKKCRRRAINKISTN